MERQRALDMERVAEAARAHTAATDVQLQRVRYSISATPSSVPFVRVKGSTGRGEVQNEVQGPQRESPLSISPSASPPSSTPSSPPDGEAPGETGVRGSGWVGGTGGAGGSGGAGGVGSMAGVAGVASPRGVVGTGGIEGVGRIGSRSSEKEGGLLDSSTRTSVSSNKVRRDHLTGSTQESVRVPPVRTYLLYVLTCVPMFIICGIYSLFLSLTFCDDQAMEDSLGLSDAEDDSLYA